jgi:hypothetical protein
MSGLIIIPLQCPLGRWAIHCVIIDRKTMRKMRKRNDSLRAIIKAGTDMRAHEAQRKPLPTGKIIARDPPVSSACQKFGVSRIGSTDAKLLSIAEFAPQ